MTILIISLIIIVVGYIGYLKLSNKNLKIDNENLINEKKALEVNQDIGNFNEVQKDIKKTHDKEISKFNNQPKLKVKNDEKGKAINI